jgi:polysaccharide biosynthesis transport protein
MIPGLKARVFSLHDVLMYLALARRHLRLMTLIIAFSLMCGLTYYIFARPVYYAQALIHVDEFALPNDTEILYRDSRKQVLPSQLTAPHILARTAKALGVDGTHDDLQRNYLTKIRALYDSQSNLVVDVWAALPELADQWTEVMMREFLAYREERRKEDRDSLEKNYSEEMKDVVTRMEQQLGKKFGLQNERGLTELLIRLNSINSLPEELSRLQSRIDELGRIRIRLQDPALQDDVVAKLSLIASAEENGDPLKPGDEVANVAKNGTGGENGGKEADRTVRSFIVVPSLLKAQHSWDLHVQEQADLKEEIAKLGETYLPGHKKMADPLKKLATVTEKLAAQYQTAQQRFDLEFQQLINKKSDLESKVPEYKEIREKYERLRVEIGISDAAEVPFRNYLIQMKKKREEVSYAGDKERINLEYGGLIESRDRPVSPNRLKLIILSLAIGLVLALGVPFLIEYLDHTLRSLDQVESAFHMRALGIVPQIDASSVGAAALISRDENHKDSLIENFRVIRTNVISMGNLTKPPHVTMVTSAMPKEGKTVVSSNLAVSFAHTGARTLLIDTDLRRGRLHRLFGYRKDPGLSNVLLNEVSLEEACRQTGEENLSILSAGRHLESGTELLGSPRFAELMATLRQRYDRIVIDTPPVLGLSETSIMQNHVDGVLFVIWTGHTPARSARTAVDMLAANGANFYGFVLNRLDLSATANYYQYYYYSHDYYYQHPLENA